jgi:hypothetical protein
MCNNGYHTIHHNRAGLHWSTLAEAHEREVVPRIDPSLNEKSMFWYLLRTYLLIPLRPQAKDVAQAERQYDAAKAGSPQSVLAPREVRRAAAEAASA